METKIKLQIELEQMLVELLGMKNSPLESFEREIKSAWDDYLYQKHKDQDLALPWYCGSFSLYNIGLKGFANSFDVTKLEDYQKLESKIKDLQSEINT